MMSESLSRLSVFLSASVPESLKGYAFAQAELSLISALTRAVLEEGGTLVFGGHPSVTPLVHSVRRDVPHGGDVVVFQSEFFREKALSEILNSDAIASVRWTPKHADVAASLLDMRKQMVKEATVAVFAGGKTAGFQGNRPGLVEEFELFKAEHPSSPVYLIGMLQGATQDLIQQHAVRETNGLSDDDRERVHHSDSVDLVVGLIMADLRRNYRRAGAGPSRLAAHADTWVASRSGSKFVSSEPRQALFNNAYNQSLSVLGYVERLLSGPGNEPICRLVLRSGDVVEVSIDRLTAYQPLMNLDNVNRDRYPPAADTVIAQAGRYLLPGNQVSVEGIHQRHNGRERFVARRINLLQQAPVQHGPSTTHSGEMAAGAGESRYYFEFTYWWINQIQRLADKWLDDLFGDSRNYSLADFAKLYRTTLNILGLPTDDAIQEMATLSRLIYGLSSAYLLTGIERYYLAAKAGVEYQRESFRGSSADGRYCIWTSAKRRTKYGTQYMLTAQSDDDKGTIPLYEQIYALAGITQYYRITNDHLVLEDIRRTIQFILDFFRDNGDNLFFSHLDVVTWKGDDPSLKENQSRKNWNSIGDHIPAYLVNLILALDPLPTGRADLKPLLYEARTMLRDAVDAICTTFPERDANGNWMNPYVRERFKANGEPDLEHGWQQNRAIVGHNLKIAWNLTRAANYFLGLGDPARAQSCAEVANQLGQNMIEHGLDLVRGGCFDAVERESSSGFPISFAWGDTKDFWQQEQGVLAYLILHGQVSAEPEQRKLYLDLARDMMAFWNLYFLDRDNQGVFFRVNENGIPIIGGNFGNKAGHSIAGYHSFELNYLAHIYIRSFVSRPVKAHQKFCLYFRPSAESRLRSINVLPDFYRPGSIEISAVTAGGERTEWEGRTDFQIPLRPDHLGEPLVVELQPLI